jgi:hypothetical protein
MAAQIRRQHPEPSGQAFLGELAKTATVRVDSVHAHDGRRARVAPLVQLQQHR